MTSSYSVAASLLGGFDLEFWAGRTIVVEVILSHSKQLYESHLKIVYFRLRPYCVLHRQRRWRTLSPKKSVKISKRK